MSLVLLSKRMETPFVFSFWQYQRSLQACANGHAYVRPVLVRIRERCVHLHWPNVVVGEKKSGNSGQHSKTYKRLLNMTFWTFSSTWRSSCSIWRISNLFAFFKFERKWKLFAKKKKCYIALWIICVLWTFNLLDSISISNNSTRLLSNNKKKKCSKTKRVVLEPFVPTGKEQLRNYFKHTMFA